MVKETSADIGNSAARELQQFYGDYQVAADELARLQRLTDAIANGELTDELLDVCPELIEEQKKNEKLKYRKNILEKSLAEQQKLNAAQGASKKSTSNTKPEYKKSEVKEKVGGAPPKVAVKVNYVKVMDYGSSILGRLTDLFQKAIDEAFPDVNIPVMLAETSNAKFGDYQCNSAMGIAGKLRLKGVSKKPNEVATEVVARLIASPLIDKTEVVPAGFINVFLSQEYIKQQVALIGAQGVQLPQIEKRRVLVDFSAPNIAKEMHVGHLRSTIIGDAICRLLERMQLEVDRVSHIGDWGTQFGMLIAHLYDTFPDFLASPPAIADLQTFYRESKKRFDSDPEFKKRSYQCVVKLQSFEPEFVKAWTLICDVSKKYNAMVYDRLDIVCRDVGESFYQDKMVKLIEYLKKNFPEKLQEDEGRLLFFPSGCDVPLTVVKSDGGFTYDTSDLAALKYRLHEAKMDWLIYVVDAGQSLHLESVYAVGRELGWYESKTNRVEHVMFGLVLGEDKKKFKTRSGDTVRLLDLLDEGIKRATEKLMEKGRDKVMTADELACARDAVAYGCIKYADLSHTRTQDYVFSFDRMLDDKGNTAVYLLYAFARIRSIVRTSGVDEAALQEYVQKNTTLPLSHPAEMKLAKQILKLADCILLVLDSLLIHQLCDYVYQLATVFHDFYTECYVIEKKGEETTIHMHRLALCDVTANTMAVCFDILGIRQVPKM